MTRRVLLLLLVFAGGCLWRSYEDILGIHLDVLTTSADKLGAVAASGNAAPATGMAEYRYPAKRARQFLQQFSKHEKRASYQGLRTFLDRYEKMVDEVDAARPGGTLDVSGLKVACAELRVAAVTIRSQAAQGD